MLGLKLVGALARGGTAFVLELGITARTAACLAATASKKGNEQRGHDDDARRPSSARGGSAPDHRHSVFTFAEPAFTAAPQRAWHAFTSLLM